MKLDMGTNLERILQEKSARFVELQRKLSALYNQEITVSYTLDLDWNEQVKYAKLGSFLTFYDLQNYGKKYKS